MAIRPFKKLVVLSFSVLYGMTLAGQSFSFELDDQALAAKKRYEAQQQQEEDKYYDYLSAIPDSGKLTPTQIKAIRAWKSQVEYAKESEERFKRARQTIIYSDDNPPVIIIGKDRLSSITFVDSAGNPYPIQSFIVSDKNAFTVTQRNTDRSAGVATVTNQMNTAPINYQDYLTKSKDEPPPKPKAPVEITKPKKELPPSMFNSLTILGQSKYANGDLIVYLVGKQNAVHIFLESSNSHYDYQTNITVDGLTALSQQSIETTGLEVGSPNRTLMEFLNGTPPNLAKTMEISLPFSQAWELGKYFYIRTKAELQSPAYLVRVTTATGYKVFKIINTTHVLSMVDHGRLKTVYINEPPLAGEL